MGLDAGIYGLVGRGVRSVAELDSEAQQAKANKLALLLNQAHFDEYGRKVADDNALRAVVAGFGQDDTANVNSLYRAGRLGEAQSYQKSVLEAQAKRADITKTGVETDKARAETSSKQLESSIKAHDFHVQQLGSLTGPQDIPAWVEAGIKAGVFTPEQGAAGLQKAQAMVNQPGGFDQWRKNALQGGQNATQQLAQQFQEVKLAEDKRQFGVTSAMTDRHQRATEGLTARGQNMVDARSRESNSAAMSKPFEVTGPDGTPVLVQQDKQGNIAPVQGFGPKAAAVKPLTEGQSKSLLFGTRMQEAHKGLEALSADGVLATNPGLMGNGMVGGVVNAFSSPKQQQLAQGKRDFLAATLRRESGAVIADAEMASGDRQYFPQIGDSKEVIAQKARNRQLAIQGVLADVPEAQRTSITPKPSPKTVSFSDLK